MLIVGAGLSGAVLAERLASEGKKKVLVIDKRDHIAGNCFDFTDDNGILRNQYGLHAFHTSDKGVWDYVQKFAEWTAWESKVLSSVEGKLVNIPVNIHTVNALLGTDIQNEQEMDAWLSAVQTKYDTIENSEQMAKSRVGEVLYEKLFKNYTFKQWGKYPDELSPSVLARIPVRNNFDDRYFTDPYQALPKRGYTDFINNILSHKNIEVRLNTDFFEVKDSIHRDLLIYTGPIDQYFADRQMEKLEYRSLDFQVESYQNLDRYQESAQINYPGMEVPYTRIIEYKHLLNQKSPHTTVVKEFSKPDGEPYYPVPNKRNQDLYEKYRALAENEKNVLFVGRLASYKYFNMDEAIRNALNIYETLKAGM